MYDYGYDTMNSGDAFWGVLGAIAVVLLIIAFITLVISIITLIAQFKLYKKAGKGGWEVFVPFYNNWVLVEIAELNWYWFLTFFAPMIFTILNIPIIGWIAYYFGTYNIFYNISKKFNKGVGFAICMTLFTPICTMILGFSKSEVYNKNIPVSKDGVFGESSKDNQPVNNNINQQMYSQPTYNNVNQNQKFCPSCGTVVAADMNFCTNCGNKMN